MRIAIPISLQLIVVTSLAVAVTVGIATWHSVGKLTEQAELLAERSHHKDQQSFVRESALIAQSVALSMQYLVSTNTWSELPGSLQRTVDAYNGEGGQRGGDRLRPVVLWALVKELPSPGEKANQWATRNGPSTAQELSSIEDALNRSARDGRAGGAADPDERLLEDVVYAARPDRDSQVVFRTTIKYGEHAAAPRAQLWLAVSDAPIKQEAIDARRAARRAVDAYRLRVGQVALAMIVLGVLIAAYQGLRLAQRIRELTAQAARIAEGDLQSRVPDGRSDELGVLAQRFNFMATRIGELMEEQGRVVSLAHEMSLAKAVQESMLPPETVHEVGNLKVLGRCSPASSCGGDWWMVRTLSDERVLIVLGDATGHGIHSAMIAATARGAVEALAALDERLLVPEQVLRAIHSAICNGGDHNVLMTAFAAVLDSHTGELSYANAGQNFPYIVRCGAQRYLDDAVILAAGGNPLGDRDIPVEIRCGKRELSPGDVLVCFTDGLVERSNRAGHLFGDRRLLKVMRQQSVDGAAALVALLDRVDSEVEAYAAGQAKEDDVTLVLCQYDPPAVSQQRRAGAG